MKEQQRQTQNCANDRVIRRQSKPTTVRCQARQKEDGCSPPVSPFLKYRDCESVIQHVGNEQFFAGPGLWVPEKERAQKFPSPLDAFAEAVQQEVKEAWVVVFRKDGPPTHIPV